MPNYGFQWPQQRKYNPFGWGNWNYAKQDEMPSGGGTGPLPGSAAHTAGGMDWMDWTSLGGNALGQILNMGDRPSLNYTVPEQAPQLGAMRKNLGQMAQGQLGQEREGIRRDAARLAPGIGPEFMHSLENPAWQNYGKNLTAGEAAISQMELQSWMELQRMMQQQDWAQAELQGANGGWGDILSGAAQALPWLAFL